MNFIKQIERIQKLNRMIKAANTGTPEELASKLHISRRQLYNHIEEVRNMGLEIQYCKRQKTFYFENDHELVLTFAVQILKEDQLMKIFGGHKIFFVRAMNLHDPQANLTYHQMV